MSEDGHRPVAGAPEDTSSRRGFLRVMSWSFVAEAGGQVTTLVVGFVLAALIGPEAYGVVAMAMVYVLLIQLVQKQGITSAIIQRRALTEEHASTAFWLVLAASLLMTGASVGLAGWWADVNGVPLLQPVILALSGLLPLQALIVVQEALLRRRMEFKKVALRTAVGMLIGGMAGVGVALWHPTVWAFVIQQLTAAFASVILLWAVTAWRPRLSFSTTAARDLLGFSSGSFLSSLGVFVNNRADALLIGLFFGPVTVGIYRFAGRLVDACLGFALRPLQSLALPELSPFQDDPTLFRLRLRRLNRVAGLALLPGLGMLIACAQPLVQMLGDSWDAAVVPLQLLAVAAAVRVFGGLNGPMLQSLGRPHLQAGVTWLIASTSVTAILVAAGVLHNAPLAGQVAGVAVARLASFGTVVLVVHLVLARRLVGVSLRESLAPFAAPALGGVAAAVCGLGVGVAAPVQSLQLGLRLPLVLAVSAFAAAAMLLAVDRQARSELAGLARSGRGGSRRRLGRHRAQPVRVNEPARHHAGDG